jgi:succinate dehydrogenase/fumarate reductase flavoprotein subunit
MSGDGLAMSWRAGASLVNLEMQWWHTNDMARPESWQRMQIYPNPMLGSDKSARMVNSNGAVFFNQQEDDPMAFGPYTVQLKALVREVRAGRARYDGGYFCGFDHCTEREVDAYTTYAKPFRQLGLAATRDLVETAVTAHYRQGGVLVDTDTMRSTIPGLYVAGGLGGHSNGLIALATYDGKVVAEGVAAGIDELPMPEIPAKQIEEEEARLERLLMNGADGGLSPIHVKEIIRRIMWEDAGVEKDEASLRRALDELRHVRTNELPRMAIRHRGRRANFEWLDAIDAVNMIDAAELIVHSSLERKESRGPFIRRDYPETDNESWLAANILEKTANGFRFRTRPYELPVFKPEFIRRDNLEVAW